MRRRIPIAINKLQRNNIIVPHIKEKGNIVYGARSIIAQLGLLSRQTKDWDMFSKNPKEDAIELQGKLDKQIGFDYFYHQSGVHEGTHKVKSIGFDLIKGTPDDEGIADFSKTPTPTPKHILINGIKYRKLNEEIAAKRKAASDPEYTFRKEKDLRDLNRIRTVKKAKTLRVSWNNLKNG